MFQKNRAESSNIVINQSVDDATLHLVTAVNGNVTVNSTDKTDLTIDQVRGQNVRITADGSILAGLPGTNIAATTAWLISNTGTIGTVADALSMLSGRTYVDTFGPNFNTSVHLDEYTGAVIALRHMRGTVWVNNPIFELAKPAMVNIQTAGMNEVQSENATAEIENSGSLMDYRTDGEPRSQRKFTVAGTGIRLPQQK